MDRSTPIGGSTSPLSKPTFANVEGTAQTAHQTVDKFADTATSQVDRLSGTAHRAVNSAADAATSAAEWASNIPEKASQAQAKITGAACASIRARPLSTVAGALVVGYLLGRLARA